MHRTGPKSDTKPQDILVKFTSYLNRAKVFSKRSFLSSAKNLRPKKGVYINEHLTKQRATLFYIGRAGVKARKLTSAWTHDGATITKIQPGLKSPTKKWLQIEELTEYLSGLEVLPEPPPYRC